MWSHSDTAGMLLASRPLRRGDSTSIVAVTYRDNSEKMNEILPSLGEILRDSPYALAIFEPEDIDEIVLFLKRGKPYLRCYASDSTASASIRSPLSSPWFLGAMA